MQRYNINNRLAYLSGGVQSAGGMWPSVAAGSPGTTNLISWWTLDETSGTRADSHGSNDITPLVSTAYDTGIISNGLEYPNVNTAGYPHYIVDNASLSTGDIDFTLGVWFYMNTIGADRRVVAKWDYGNSNREYALVYQHSTTRFLWLVSSNGTASSSVLANNLGAPSATAWYFIVAWHDATANTINIQVNDGTVDSTSYSSGVYDSAAAFAIGHMMNNGSAEGVTNNAIIDEVFFYKRVLTSAERTWLYNSGAGRTYTDL